MCLTFLVRSLKLLHSWRVFHKLPVETITLLSHGIGSSPVFVFPEDKRMSNSLTFLREAWFKVIPEVLGQLELTGRAVVLT